jgi:hypothetical protein
MQKSTRLLHDLAAENSRLARKLYPGLADELVAALKELTWSLHVSIRRHELLLINGNWYINHSGLLRIAHRHRCLAIRTEVERNLSDPNRDKWVLRATVQTSSRKRFTGYGDANPSNISDSLRGSELRIAETRAVNRALRRAYGIGICSFEELGSSALVPSSFTPRKMPSQSANGNGHYSGPKLRDRLCQLIRQHSLDANLVKSYAVDFCGTKSLREATRDQIEAFVAHLSDWAEKDRNALLCQLNSYLPARSENEKAGAA